MHAPRLGAQRFLGPVDRFLENIGACCERDIVERCGKRFPFGLRELASQELVKRVTGDGAEGIRVDVVERDADNAAAWDEARIGEVEQPGQ